LILDRANTLPSQSALNLTGPGYVGITENAGLHMNDFLRRINSIGSSDAIAGIDSANTNTNRVVSDAIDLSVGGTRSQSYYLGTSSHVTLTGTITPPTGQSLSLTAIRGGYLTVASTLGSSIPGLIIGQTNSFDPEAGTVELTAANSYTGGTDVRGGTLRVSNNNALGLGGVSVDSGGILSVASNTTVGNAISLNSGAMLTGTGTFASANGLTVGRGAILAPGGLNTIGTLTFASGLTLGGGGILDLDTLNVNTAASALSSDRLAITGGSLTLASTGGSPFVIALYSLSSNGVNGALSGFDSHLSYHWTFATATGISGFNSNEFTFDTTHFLNTTDGGSFFVSQNGNSLVINFTPVPEPSTYALLALGLGAIGVSQLRRRARKN
jgi:autotransporter-associated beta strand protein